LACYAVTMGRKLGIFTTWEEVVEVTKDFKGASFKKFNSIEEAQRWFGDIRSVERKQSEILSKLNIVQCYIDGSFDKQIYAYAFAIVHHNEVIVKQSGVGENREAAKKLTSQASELKAAMQAALYAAKKGYKHMLIYHDNESVQYLITGKYTPKNTFTEQYVIFMRKLQETYGIKIDFTKVKAHNGNEFNELVDHMARKELQKARDKARKKKHQKRKKKRILPLTVSQTKALFKKINRQLHHYPKALQPTSKKKYEYYCAKFRTEGSLNERECYTLNRFFNQVTSYAEKEKQAESDMKPDVIRQMLLDIYPIVERYKKELKWYGGFLTQMYQLSLENKRFTNRQKVFIKQGYDLIQKKYQKDGS